MNWDPFQREVLAELGHVLYRQAGIGMALSIAIEPTTAPSSGRALLDEQMMARVARAAGMTTDALQSRLDDLQAITSLRGDAAAKRALWPRLRALRRQDA